MLRLPLPLALCALALLACGDAPPSAPAPEVPPRQVALDPSVPADTVRGVVVFDGLPPPRAPLRMQGVAGCAAEGEPRLSETLVVADGRVANVLVYAKEGVDPAATFPVPPATALLDQCGCTFVPHVVALRVGQRLRVHNSDPTTHNVNVRSRRTDAANFNQVHPPGSTDLEFAFTSQELSIACGCDIHPWMSAWVHVLAHPYFALTGGDGRFEIRGLAPGRYRFEVVHEWLGRQSFEVELDGRSGAEVVVHQRAP